MEHACTYCEHPVIKEANGWGYYISQDAKLVYFHSECINIFEGVVLAL